MISELMFYLIFIVQAFLTLIVIFNFLSPVNLKKKKIFDKKFDEKVSILIPLRNEEENVFDCIKNVLNQKNVDFEVICLDDNSEDRTFEKLTKLSRQNEKLKILKGEKLPSGWTGKNWACFQLAGKSTGDYLVFLDADVRLDEEAVYTAVMKMKRLNVSMLSVFPTQIMKSLGEYLIVPSMNWLLLTFLPLHFVYKFSHPSFVAANGQFIVFRREDYFRIGGHEAVRNKIVEDMEFARLMKTKKYKIVTLLGSNLIFARMYKNFSDAINGFFKNFYPGFNITSFKFSVLLIVIFALFILPFILIFVEPKFLAVIVMMYVQKIFISIKSNQNIMVNLFLFPLQLIFVIVIGIGSMTLTKRGKLAWKGRYLKIKD